MLRRAAVACVAALLVTLASQQAEAVSPVSCPGLTLTCYVDVSSPSTPAAGTGSAVVPTSGGPKACTINSTGESVPCYDPYWGWFDATNECYWKLTNPQPPDSPTWEGHYPNGAVYDVYCPVIVPGSHAGRAWLASPPPGYGGGPSPAQLAQEAVAQMQLAGPAIQLSIPAGRFGIVGVPVWLWTQVGPTTWGPNSATASVPGLSVTATAHAQQIVWDTGDGETVTCANPGTPYAAGEVTSPTCQHIYATSSAAMPGEAFPLTATTTWLVTWSGGGSSGSLTVRRSSSASVRIGEVQVLVTNG